MTPQAKRKFRIVWLALLLLLPVVLLLLPKEYFNEGQSLCLSVLLFDRSCPGCGMTRALMHLIHLDFQTAWEFNRLSFLVFPLFTWLWIREILKTYRSLNIPK